MSGTQISPLGSYKAATSPAARRGWNLALCFQEVLTVIVRLRAKRQDVPNAEAFRTQMKQALRAAEQDAIARGYNQDDVRRVIFAIVAFLDESVLSSHNPVFADWPRLPLQAELYGHQLAGEILFEELQKILGRGDSPETADVLEVFYLCLVMGFQGRYAAGGRGDLRSILMSIREKIQRIRGGSGVLSPHGALPADAVRLAQSDPWIRKLATGAIAALGTTVLFYIAFKLLLMSGISQLSGLTAGMN